jgi:DNA-binding MarR family transcriptional regulator
MTDIISKNTPSPASDDNEEETRDHEAPQLLTELIELFFFAYRDFTQDPDTILTEFGFGRAHHRVLHFVNRYPGLRVADLLDILKITKQSLARVLKQLVDKGIIEQRPGKSDRRERRLYVTNSGQKLANRLIEPQLLRIRQALQMSGVESEQISRKFLYNMINSTEHDAVMKLFSHSHS